MHVLYPYIQHLKVYAGMLELSKRWMVVWLRAAVIIFVIDAMLIGYLSYTLFFPPELTSRTAIEETGLRPGPATAQLMQDLRAHGYEPVSVYAMGRKHFSGSGRTIVIDNDNIQAFEYADSFTARQEIDALAEKYTISSRPDSWKKNVHLYARDNVAVFYLGNDQRITQSLEKTLGMAAAIPAVRATALTKISK